jgi:ribonuclease-3
MEPDRQSQLRGLEERLGYHFTQQGILDRALTHTSAAHEVAADAIHHNEPLEFLGDAVIGFVISDMLHRRDPDGDEGTKSRTRAHLVSATSLAKRSLELGLPELLLLGKGEEKTGGRRKSKLWADAYEAVIAAMYLDGGLETVYRFLGAEFAKELENEGAISSHDAKSALQEFLQARGEPLPEYVVVAEEGPSHRRRFRVRCLVKGSALAEGEGTSKKSAQQQAAQTALGLLREPSG